jgi:hypothetical protein
MFYVSKQFRKSGHNYASLKEDDDGEFKLVEFIGDFRILGEQVPAPVKFGVSC